MKRMRSKHVHFRNTPQEHTSMCCSIKDSLHHSMYARYLTITFLAALIHHIAPQKYVPSNLFTFAPQAFTQKRRG